MFRPEVGVFVAPVTGIYHLTVNLVASGARDSMTASLRLAYDEDGVPQSVRQVAGPGVMTWGVDLLLYSGVEVVVQVDNRGTRPIAIRGGDATWFTGRLAAEVTSTKE